MVCAHLRPSLSPRHQLSWRQMTHIGQVSRTQGGTLRCLPEVMTLPGAPGSPGRTEGVGERINQWLDESISGSGCI